MNESDAVVETKTLTLATFVTDSCLEKMVSDYNQGAEKYHIEIADYSEYNISDDEYDWSLGLEQLNMDMASENVPDIINVYNIDLYTYASQGYFLDLYEMMGNDEIYFKNAFLSGYLTANEWNGALYWLSPICQVETLVANADLTGGLESWDLSQFFEICQTCNESGIQVVQSPSNMFIYADRDLLDCSVNTCYFNNEQFLSIMEYASELTDYSIDYSGLTDSEAQAASLEESARWGNGEQLLQQLTIGDYSDYVQMQESAVSYTLIGYPTRDGTNGTYYTDTQYMFAIPANCTDVDAAWDFITSTLEVTYYDSSGFYYSGLPVVTSYLEVYVREETAVESGEVSDADLQAFEDFLNRIIRNSIWDSTIENTVLDEFQKYVDGMQSATDTVDLLQQKVGLYLKENA